LLLALDLRFFDGPSKVFWGIKLRYLYSRANVTDFYWYLPSAYYTDDQRIILSAEIGSE
jgi:hypothetical protein